MTQRLTRRWAAILGAGGPVILLQQGCALDPDLLLQAFLQVFTEVSIFALDNALVALR